MRKDVVFLDTLKLEHEVADTFEEVCEGDATGSVGGAGRAAAAILGLPTIAEALRALEQKRSE